MVLEDGSLDEYRIFSGYIVKLKSNFYLDISVDNSQGMAVVNRIDHWADGVCGLLLRKTFSIHDHVKELQHRLKIWKSVLLCPS
jgi:hypothetical protein